MRVHLSTDKATCYVSLGPARFSLSADDVSDLLDHLLKARAQMLPPVEAPIELDDDIAVGTVMNPKVQVFVGPDGANVLMLRHPVLGWLGFEFDAVAYAELRDDLT